MSIITNAFLVCVLCVALYNADDFHFGSQANSQLGYQETVKLSSIPLKSRTKNVYYNSNNTKIIKAISAIDMEKTKAKATITAGGIGAPFVNIKLNGERGKNLRYLVQVYV